ncbi:hypothetical protein JYY64_003590 [Salmonella enterica subsp. houtenae serovar 50:g,z51:-]|nr:hypothetical protein [Salmonella enterica subsp. houtenae serovar 50:g,z51:-]
MILVVKPHNRLQVPIKSKPEKSAHHPVLLQNPECPSQQTRLKKRILSPERNALSGKAGNWLFAFLIEDL